MKVVSSVGAVAAIIAMANIVGVLDVMFKYSDYYRLSFIATWFVFNITEYYSYSMFRFR